VAQERLRALGAAVDQLDGAVAWRFRRNRTDLRVMELLQGQGPLSPSELAAATRLTNAALTAVVDRLVSGGFVQRRPDPADRRRVLVELTDVARHLAEETFAGLFRRVDGVLARYSDDELAVIVDFLTRTREAFLEHVADLLAREARTIRRRHEPR